MSLLNVFNVKVLNSSRVLNLRIQTFDLLKGDVVVDAVELEVVGVVVSVLESVQTTYTTV